MAGNRGQRGVGSGEWGSGEWGVGSGGVGSGEWGVGSGEWGVGGALNPPLISGKHAVLACFFGTVHGGISAVGDGVPDLLLDAVLRHRR